MPTRTLPRNGQHHGDVSYISFGAPDPAVSERFYTAVLGRPEAEMIPQLGNFDGRMADGSLVQGAVLCFRVDDIALAVERVRAAGGGAAEPIERPYGIESLCQDDQGLAFYLHQMEPEPGEPVELANGHRQGDVAYITVTLPDLAAAERFYGSVLGWRFGPSRNQTGRSIEGMAPMGGMWPAAPGVVLAYRVDDLGAALERVTALGGRAASIEQRSYGLAADGCLDDQGIEFNLLQLG